MQSVRTIPLIVIESVKKTGKPFEFRVKTKDKTAYYFTTKSDRSRSSWLRACTLLLNRQPQNIKG